MANDKLDTIVLLLTQGITVERAVDYCVKRFSVNLEEAEKLVEQARRKITVAAEYVKEEQLGTAITRLNDLYSKSINDKDIKTALQAQRELNRLMGLYSDAPQDADADDGQAARRLELISNYILPLKLTDEKFPIEEHVRVAADYLRQNKIGGIFQK
ncbi:MAG: hypothetical protein A2Y12_01305 [Planctomycetes bacterium GWF2_42_9]|nr:MAG: hypothetical protein A2Y12_01305 [Planctomycetes bacterium GWF2_42_9]